MPDAFLVVMGVRRQIPVFYVLFSFIITKEVETEILFFFKLKVNIFSSVMPVMKPVVAHCRATKNRAQRAEPYSVCLKLHLNLTLQFFSYF